MRKTEQRIKLAEHIEALNENRRDLAIAEGALERAKQALHQARADMETADVPQSSQMARAVDRFMAGEGGVDVLDNPKTIDRELLKERYDWALGAYDELKKRVAATKQKIEWREHVVVGAVREVFQSEVTVQRHIEAARATFLEMLPRLSLLKFLALKDMLPSEEAQGVNSFLNEIAIATHNTSALVAHYPNMDPWLEAIAGMKENPHQKVPSIS